MYAPGQLDPDLEGIREALHKVDDDKLFAVQKKRDRKEVGRHLTGDYSLTRLLGAQQHNAVATQAPFEHMCSERIAERLGIQPRPGYSYVPVDRRDLTVASSSGGGYLVSVDTSPGGQFIEFLDSAFPFQRLGIRRLNAGRPSNVPGVSATVSAGFLATEGTQATESTPVFLQASSGPKSIVAYTEISRQLLLQTSPVTQQFLWAQLAQAVSAALSRALITGAGANGAVQGLFGYTGVNTVGAASASYATCLNMLEKLEQNSALVTPTSTAFVAPSNISKLLRTRERATGSGVVMDANIIAGFPVVTTEAASPNSMSFGDFSQMVLITYDSLQVATDPFGSSSSLFKTGLTGIRVLWMCDMILLNPKSFCTSGALS